jgi:hypothetical protein
MSTCSYTTTGGSDHEREERRRAMCPRERLESHGERRCIVFEHLLRPLRQSHHDPLAGYLVDRPSRVSTRTPPPALPSPPTFLLCPPPRTQYQEQQDSLLDSRILRDLLPRPRLALRQVELVLLPLERLLDLSDRARDRLADRSHAPGGDGEGPPASSGGESGEEAAGQEGKHGVGVSRKVGGCREERRGSERGPEGKFAKGAIQPPVSLPCSSLQLVRHANSVHPQPTLHLLPRRRFPSAAAAEASRCSTARLRTASFPR